MRSQETAIRDFKSLTFILKLMAKTKNSSAEHAVHITARPTHNEAVLSCTHHCFRFITFLITEISQGLIFIEQTLTEFSPFLRFKFQKSCLVFKHPTFQNLKFKSMSVIRDYLVLILIFRYIKIHNQFSIKTPNKIFHTSIIKSSQVA